MLPTLDYGGWSEVRAHHLEWLTFDCIDPHELAEACAADPDWRIRNLAGYLNNDLSLRLVWTAVRLCPGSR